MFTSGFMQDFDPDYLSTLPIEMLFHIFSYMEPWDFTNLVSVNWEIAGKINRFWLEKFRKHFPEFSINNNFQNANTNWYVTFRNNYETQYQQFTPEEKKLISAAKDGKKLNFEWLCNTDAKNHEKNLYTSVALYILKWGQTTKNLALLNQFYEHEYNNFKNGQVPGDFIRVLNLLPDNKEILVKLCLSIKYYQPVSYIEELLAEMKQSQITSGVFNEIILTLICNFVRSKHALEVFPILWSKMDNLANHDIQDILEEAAFWGHLQVMHDLLQLIKESQDADKQSKEANKFKPDFPVLLYQPIRKKDEDMVKLLLKHGADINECDKDGNIFILKAASDDNHEVVSFLLNPHFNCNIDVVDPDGKTSLVHAVLKDNLSMITILTEVHAKIGPFNFTQPGSDEILTSLDPLAACQSLPAMIFLLIGMLKNKEKIEIKQEWIDALQNQLKLNNSDCPKIEPNKGLLAFRAIQFVNLHMNCDEVAEAVVDLLKVINKPNKKIPGSIEKICAKHLVLQDGELHNICHSLLELVNPNPANTQERRLSK